MKPNSRNLTSPDNRDVDQQVVAKIAGQVSEDSRSISELRNLGPACERDLHAVGIYSADDIRRLGIEGTFVKLMESKRARGSGGTCFNASYLYALYGALHDCDWRDVPDEKKIEFKALTARLRSQHATRKARS